MKRTAGLLLAALAFTVVGLCTDSFAQDNTLSEDEKAEGWQLLFDGKTLLGWVHRGGAAQWRVENGMISVEAAGRRPSYIGTAQEFTNFHLKVDFRQDEGHNSGVFLRGPRNPKAGINQRSFYEVNIADQHRSGYVTGSVVDIVKNETPPKTAGKWNTYDITAEGRHIVVKLNGATTADIQDATHYSGVLALQAFGKGSIRFRNIKIRELP